MSSVETCQESILAAVFRRWASNYPTPPNPDTPNFILANNRLSFKSGPGGKLKIENWKFKGKKGRNVWHYSHSPCLQVSQSPPLQVTLLRGREIRRVISIIHTPITNGDIVRVAEPNPDVDKIGIEDVGPMPWAVHPHIDH